MRTHRHTEVRHMPGVCLNNNAIVVLFLYISSQCSNSCTGPQFLSFWNNKHRQPQTLTIRNKNLLMMGKNLARSLSRCIDVWFPWHITDVRHARHARHARVCRRRGCMTGSRKQAETERARGFRVSASFRSAISKYVPSQPISISWRTGPYNQMPCAAVQPCHFRYGLGSVLWTWSTHGVFAGTEGIQRLARSPQLNKSHHVAKIAQVSSRNLRSTNDPHWSTVSKDIQRVFFQQGWTQMWPMFVWGPAALAGSQGSSVGPGQGPQGASMLRFP